MDISMIAQKTPPEITASIAQNVRSRRKERKLTQAKLAMRSGVSLGSVKRFETTGEISLSSLIRIAIVLECEDDFAALFARKHYNSIEDVINEQTKYSSRKV